MPSTPCIMFDSSNPLGLCMILIMHRQELQCFCYSCSRHRRRLVPLPILTKGAPYYRALKLHRRHLAALSNFGHVAGLPQTVSPPDHLLRLRAHLTTSGRGPTCHQRAPKTTHSSLKTTHSSVLCSSFWLLDHLPMGYLKKSQQHEIIAQLSPLLYFR